jgi:hypothetical protein
MEPEENEELGFRNELEKLKLQGEFGAKFFSGNTDLPPEIEAEWLKNVRAFEEVYQDTPDRKLRDIIGNPAFMPIAELMPDQLEAELKKLTDLLAENHIAIDHDDEVPLGEIYRFITEDLMDHEMQVFGLPGMVTHIIYEEFYPNHLKDIIRRCEDFCRMLFEKSEYLENELDHELVFATGEIMSSKELVEKANDWFDTYPSFTVNKLGFMKPEFTLEQGMGHVHFFIDYDTHTEGGNKLNFTGPGIFYVHYIYGSWFICGMDFPGFKEWAFR